MAGNILLEDPAIIKIAEKYCKTSAQICLRFLVQRGICVIPKSLHEERIKSNFDVFAWTLADEDFILLENLDCKRRWTAVPWFDFDKDWPN